MSTKILNKRSSIKDKYPTVSELEYGEIAVNYAEGSEALSIKNSSNNVIQIKNTEVLQKTGTSTTATLSQAAITSAVKEGVNNVSTLTSVPVDKRLIYATISEKQSLTFDTTKYASCFDAFDKGAQIKIIAYNASTSVLSVSMPWSDSSYTCFQKSISIPVGGYGVITADYDGTTIFINAEVKEKADGYIGGEAIVALAHVDSTTNETTYEYVKDKDLKTFKDNDTVGYTPIGIVIVPKSHTSVILKDGDPRKGKNIIMSLKPMSYDTPESGATSETNMYWGQYNVDTSLTNFNVCNVFSSASSQSAVTTQTNGYLPSDRFSGTASDANSNLKYSSTSNVIPSPYKLVDGEWLPNEDYYGTSVSALNALSDFNGISNTKVLTDLATSQSDWTTADSITNNSGSGYSPAACCCARFKTTGTKSFVEAGDSYNSTGVWYLPACGELGYIMPNFSANQTALSNVQSLYGTTLVVAVQLDSGSNFWSSSEDSSCRARYVYTGDGYVNGNGKNVNHCVRAFCALA